MISKQSIKEDYSAELQQIQEKISQVQLEQLDLKRKLADSKREFELEIKSKEKLTHTLREIESNINQLEKENKDLDKELMKAQTNLK